MIRGIKFAGIPVRDQDRSLRFYTRQLGSTIVTDPPFDDHPRWIELRIPGAESSLVLFTPPGQEDRIGTFSNVTFYAGDVQRTYEEMRDRGVEFVQEPRVEHWGTSALFRDPDGNTFVLSSR